MSTSSNWRDKGTVGVTNDSASENNESLPSHAHEFDDSDAHCTLHSTIVSSIGPIAIR